MSTLVFPIWELQLSAPKEEDVGSLVFMLLPVAERKGLSAGNKAERFFSPSPWPFPQSLLAKSQERLIVTLYKPRMNQEKAHDHEFNIPLPWKAYGYMSNIVIVKVMK